AISAPTSWSSSWATSAINHDGWRGGRAKARGPAQSGIRTLPG
ncbi:uncharacterized protein METZ01_LOCUS255852, partial [marine metagenome]